MRPPVPRMPVILRETTIQKDPTLDPSEVIALLSQLSSIKESFNEKLLEAEKAIEDLKTRKVEELRGEMPIAGVHYPIPKDGYTPIKGIDYVDGRPPTSEELLTLIRPLIPRVKDGKTPSADEITALISPLIPQVRDGKDSDANAVAELVIERLIKEKKLKAKDIDGFEDALAVVRNFVARGSIRGGGDTVKAGSGVTITTDANNVKTISATGATIASETPAETPDGIIVAFTVTHTPLFIIADSNFRVSGQGYTYSSPTITMDALIPPVAFIRSYYAA